MILKVRVSEPVGQYILDGKGAFSAQHSVHGRGATEKLKVLEVTPELNEKEQLLAKVFGTQFSQGFKEVMATVINKLYQGENHATKKAS